MSAAVTLAPVLEAALRARDAGISVMPVAEDGSKGPAGGTWKRHMRSIPGEDEIRHRFASSTGIAFICGTVSGGLECLDFDKRDAFEAFCELARASGHGELLERVMRGYHESSPRGVHLLYRCNDARSTKLARRVGDDGKAKAIIETKGEGGYVIVAPSHGGVHPDGIYELVSGSIEAIVTLTDEERAALHEIARALDEGMQTAPAHVEPELEPLPSGGGERPGDEWARMTSWPEILEPAGWRRVYQRGEVTFWRRPGKSVGISATTGYAGSGLFYPFTTSTGFEAGRGYGKFSAYSLLEHGGDYRAASRCLREQGFGQPYRPSIEAVDLSALTSRPKTAPKSSSGFPAHLFDVPGLVGELHRYIVASAPKPQPIIALGAAVCAIGTLVGRRVQGETGTRTNVYIAALCETGGGKEWTRTAVRRAFRAVNLEPMVAIDDVTSDAAIYGVLQDHPSCLWSIDELGVQLGELRDRKGGAGVLRTITTLYGLSQDVCFAKTYARDRRTERKGNDVVIHQPNLSVYGTTVPGRFWGSLTTSESLDGFLNRFLVMSSEDPNPPYHRVPIEQQGPPAALVEQLGRWRPSLGYSASIGAREAPPPALTIRADTEAQRVFDSLEEAVRERIGRLHADARPEHASLFVRTHEHAARLALIRAAGQGTPDAAEIRQADATWGAELAWWCAEHVLAGVEAKIGDSEHDTRCKEAAAYLATVGAVRLNDFTRRFQRWQGRERDDVLQTLEQSGRIERVAERSGKRGPKSVGIRWVEVSS